MIYIFFGIGCALIFGHEQLFTIIEKLVDRIPHRDTSKLVRQVEKLQHRVEELEAIVAATEFERRISPGRVTEELVLAAPQTPS